MLSGVGDQDGTTACAQAALHQAQEELQDLLTAGECRCMHSELRQTPGSCSGCLSPRLGAGRGRLPALMT